jgi:hypothetical protein
MPVFRKPSLRCSASTAARLSTSMKKVDCSNAANAILLIWSTPQTLEELIEACGGGFENVCRDTSVDDEIGWLCNNYIPEGEIRDFK